MGEMHWLIKSIIRTEHLHRPPDQSINMYQKSLKYKNLSVFLLKSDQTKIPKRIKKYDIRTQKY
jgi:hypothetical protein